MHCYVINLPTATKRLERTKRELEAYCPKLSWSVPPMCIASEMSDDDFVRLYDADKAWRIDNYQMSKGEVACALSHQSALKEFLKSGDGCCLIVEDDVVFSPAMGNFLDGVEGWLGERAAKPIVIVLSEAYQVRYWAARPMFGEFRFTKPIKSCGAFAYVVNRTGAKLILEANAEPIGTTSDHWTYYRKCGLFFLGLDKILAGSSDFSRKDSSLSKWRDESKKQTETRQSEVSFVLRKSKALKAYARWFWWWLTGVDRSGEHRSNERLYLVDSRK